MYRIYCGEIMVARQERLIDAKKYYREGRKIYQESKVIKSYSQNRKVYNGEKMVESYIEKGIIILKDVTYLIDTNSTRNPDTIEEYSCLEI